MPLVQFLIDFVRQRNCPRPTYGCKPYKWVLKMSELVSELWLSEKTLEHFSTKHASPKNRRTLSTAGMYLISAWYTAGYWDMAYK